MDRDYKQTLVGSFAAPMSSRLHTDLALLALAGASLMGCGRETPQAVHPDLARFAAEKHAQAAQLAAAQTNSVPGFTWDFFEAAEAGDFRSASNEFARLMAESGRGGPPAKPGWFQSAWQWLANKLGMTPNTQSGLRTALWAPIMETYGALELSQQWSSPWLERYARDVMSVVPEGALYFGGTDAGRFAVSMFSESQIRGVPFFTLTQNALADYTYVDYLTRMYGGAISLPTSADQQKAFQDYLTVAQKRLAAGQLKQGENVAITGGRVQVSGQVAVMDINGLLVRRILEQNPEREVFLEEGLPIDLLRANLEPSGPIFKLHHEPLTSLPPGSLRANSDYWAAFLVETLGSAAGHAETTAAVCELIERIELNRDLSTFDGDRTFLEDTPARQQFALMRSAQARHYAWRATQTTDTARKELLKAAAETAFQQAWMLWSDPAVANMPQGSFARQYLGFLQEEGRDNDAERVSKVMDELRSPP